VTHGGAVHARRLPALRVRAPDKPGRHVLHAQLMVPRATVGSPFLSVPVEAILCDLPVFEYVYFPDLLEYTDLPFADEAFDGIVLFTAFHHFADPLSLLRELQRVTRQDGFIFIGCDNCVPNPRDPEYRAELRRGINEQMWTLPEYADFFRKAGLEIARARVDYHSLKVSLVKP
jgi:SAM-dependent methyltransferase